MVREKGIGAWSNFWRKWLLPGLTATIISPVGEPTPTFTQGETIPWHAKYKSPLHSWDERLGIDTNGWSIGQHTLRSGYGTDAQVKVEVEENLTPSRIQKYRKPTGSEVRIDLEKEHPCFDNPDYDCFDVEIKEAVDDWNNSFFQQKFPPPEPLEYNLVKAMIYLESGMGYHTGTNKPFPDIMQVGNPGDPAIPVLNNDGAFPTEYEAYTGQIEPLDYEGAANADSPDQSIYWGVRWLYHKAQRKPIPTGNKEFPYKPNWGTWKEAVKGYGPGTQAYVEKIWNLYQKGIDPKGGNNLF